MVWQKRLQINVWYGCKLDNDNYYINSLFMLFNDMNCRSGTKEVKWCQGQEFWKEILVSHGQIFPKIFQNLFSAEEGGDWSPFRTAYATNIVWFLIVLATRVQAAVLYCMVVVPDHNFDINYTIVWNFEPALTTTKCGL